MLLFTLGILVLAALLFRPGAHAGRTAGRAELALKTSAATSNTDAGKSRTGKIIVALQMALCVVLLVGGGLLIRTLRNLENTPLGMRVDGLVVFGVKPDIQSVPEGVAFYQEPDEQAARSAGRGIGDHHGGAYRFVVVEQQRHDGRRQVAGRGERIGRDVRSNVVGPDFFHTLGVPVLAGRDFADSDTATSPHVGIINEQFAKRFLPNQNPLGHTHWNRRWTLSDDCRRCGQGPQIPQHR